jgi:hypothetical protein
MKEEWLMPGAVVPVDPETTKALTDEIKRLIGVVGGLVLKQGPDYERGFIDGMQKQAQSSVDRAVNAMAGVYSDIVSDGGMDPRNQPEPQRWAVFCGGCRKQGSVAYQHPGKTICDDCVAKLRGTTPKQTSIETAMDAMDEVAHRFAHRLALDLECVLAKYEGPWYDQAWDTLSQYRSEMNKLHEQVSPTFMGEPLIKDAP